jgi:hypothetical protein
MKRRLTTAVCSVFLLLSSITPGLAAESNTSQTQATAKVKAQLIDSGEVSIMGLTYGPYPLRFYGEDDYEQYEFIMGAAGNIDIRLVQLGVHSGEQATTRWTLENTFGNEITSIDVVGDKNPATIRFTGLSRGERYYVKITPLNDNDMEGNFYFYVPDGTEVYRNPG